MIITSLMDSFAITCMCRECYVEVCRNGAKPLRMLGYPHDVIMLHSCHMQYIAQESVRLVMNMDGVLANTTGIVQWPSFANVLCAISSGIVTCCTAEMTAI